MSTGQRQDFYNNDGANEGAGASGIPAVGLPYSTAEAPSQVSYGSYYQNDGMYTTPSANKPPPKKKPPMSKAGMATISGPPRGTAGPVGGYQTGSLLGQGSYNQYGQGKKSFNQNQQSGTIGYSYSTAYPSQVTGSAGSNQDYNYDGFNTLPSYSSQGVGNQGFGPNHTQYHNQGYGRGDGSMNYQYR